MRLLILTQYFWPEDFRINDLTERLVSRGHSVTVLTGLPNYPSGKLATDYSWRGPYTQSRFGARVVRVPVLPRGCGSGLRLILNYLSFAISSSVVGAFRCRSDYDAIFVFQPSPVTIGIPARLLSRLTRAPVLFWVQDLWPETLSATGSVTSPFALWVVEALVKWIYRGCALVLVQSEAFTEHIANQDVPTNRIAYFPNSAEEFYRPLPKDANWSGPALPIGFRVMFAGNVGAAQSFETIIAAAKLLISFDEIHWIIVGDGRQADWVKKEISTAGLNGRVHLMGRHPVETMPDWFAQADVMLVSLRSDPIFAMTIPAKVQSYMACAKPIAALLDGEGARIVSEARAGIVAKPGDAQQLADAVRKLYGMSDAERTAMGRNGFEYFQRHFAGNRLMARLDVWLSQVVGDSAP